MTAQSRYDLLINQTEAVACDYCKLRAVVAVARGDRKTVVPSVARES